MKRKDLKQMIRESISEVISDKMVGLHEMVQFYRNAPLDKIQEVERLLGAGENSPAWEVIVNFLETAQLLIRRMEESDSVNEINWKKALGTAAVVGSTMFGTPDIKAANSKPDVTQTKSRSSLVDYFKNVENGAKVGFDKKSNVWKSIKGPAGGEIAIAYGHNIKPGENFTKGITDQEANRLLEKDIESSKRHVYKDISRYGISKLTPEQEEMLIDFDFNIGSVNKFPKLTRAVLNKDWNTVKKEYKRTYVDRSGKKKELRGRNEAFYNRFLANK